MSATEKRLLATLEEARLFATQETGTFRRPIVPAPEFDRHPRIAAELTADAKARGGTLAELVNAAWQDGFVDVSVPFDEGQRLWVAESFWARHDTDSDGYQSIDCGPCLDLGAKHHPGWQYCASPANAERPDEPGDWWEAPPPDWDGDSDYRGRGVQEWLAWGNFYSKHSSAQMPRWMARTLTEVTSVTVEQNDGRWEWAFGWKRVTP